MRIGVQPSFLAGHFNVRCDAERRRSMPSLAEPIWLRARGLGLRPRLSVLLLLSPLSQVKNLRSVVSPDTISTMAHLFTREEREMDSEVEDAARTLLHKAGETSLFIRRGVELALSTMVLSCSPGRVLQVTAGWWTTTQKPALEGCHCTEPVEAPAGGRGFSCADWQKDVCQ